MPTSNPYDNSGYSSSGTPPPPPASPPPPPKPATNSGGGTKAAAIALGGTAALAGAAFLASQQWGQESVTNNGSETPHPDVIPPGKPHASINQVEPVKPEEPEKPDQSEAQHPTHEVAPHEQTFAEAFAEARAEHGGGGGHFVWHGDTYNTYTVEEWDHLSAPQKDEFLVSVYGESYQNQPSHAGSEVDSMTDVPHSETVLAHDSPSADVPNAESTTPADGTDATATYTIDPSPDSGDTRHSFEKIEQGTIQTESGDVDYVLAKVDGHDVVYIDANQDGKLEIAYVDNDGDHVLETKVTLDPSTHAVTHVEPMQHPVDLADDHSSEGHLAGQTNGQSATQHVVHVLDTGTINTETGTADYVLTSVDGHNVAYFDVNHDGMADEVLVDMDNDNVADAHGSYDPTTHELTNLEEIHHPAATEEITYADEGPVAYDDQNLDYNGNADISDWVG
ncbi:hypothetical protein [Spirosoma sp.]|uniref:hypothetical protein n=1 Tax=Spirosoma sp. TaxID=1899569 RepID=UPI00262F75EF|nr:hypothetical protein [Spirosoma sp.]MCX6216969.1 hypothetical protein [Spirosoma sp.]